MNHIYKTIWSKVNNSYIVVSEIAGTVKKSGRVRSSKPALAAVLAAFLLTGISVSPASAAIDGVTKFVEPGNQNIKIGNDIDLRNNSTKNGAIAIGDHAQIDDYVMQEGSIAIGKNAFVENMWETQDKIFRFGMHSTDPSRTDHLLPAGIAIGQNTYARSGSLMIGDHKYVGALGDTTVNSNTDDEKRKLSVLVGATTVGMNSYSAGAFATTTGAYSIMTNAYDGNTNQGFAAQNFGAVINGSFNSIESKTAGSSVSGIANAVVGTANRTYNANGTLVFGAGNEVTNSVENIADPMSLLTNSSKELAEKLREGIRRNDSGGAVLAVGGGNKADYAYRSQLIGVGNTLTGTAAEKAAYNLLNGYKNTGTNVSGVTVIGTNRTISNAKDTIVMGSSAGGITTTVSKAVILGSEANAEKDGGVALGANSIASVDKGVAGYDPSTKLASTDTSATWKATVAAVSVGKAATPTEAAVTRQITNVAAGTQDTDVVNVAQLKAVQTAADAAKMHYYSVKSTERGSDSNYNNDGAKGDNSLAAGVKANTMSHNSVAIGMEATISDSNGGRGSGDIAIGNKSSINNYVDQGGSIAIGQNSKVENMAGQQEAIFAFGQTTYSGNWWSSARIPADPSKVAGGIAIGENTFARTGSLMVGTHNYKGKLGDMEIDSANTRATGVNVNATTLGTNSYNLGAFSTVTGAYSIASGNYEGGRNTYDANKNFGATIMGSLNSIESATASSRYSGIANSIVGTANRTFNSNGSMIFGAGNEITNSITSITAPSDGGSSAKELSDKLRTAVKNSNIGGATIAVGGGNTADYTQASQIIGVNNTLKGSSGKVSKYNMLDGYKNIGTNINHVSVIGSENEVENTDDALVLGNKRKLSGANGSIILGSGKNTITTAVNNAVAIGNETSVEKEGGVALGANSIASVDKGVAGYDPFTKLASTDTSATWKSTVGAVSVGDASKDITRQITGVAAGTQDTDAVNVAQLKALEKKLSKGGSNVEVQGDEKTGIVVEKDPKENTSTPSTGGTTPSTGGTTPSTGGTTPAPAAESKTVYKVKLDKKVDVGNISIDGTENKETITIGKGDNNVIVNNTGLTIKDGPSVTKNGIDAGNKKITNVADATEDSDAVNYKQLKQATQGMTEVSGEINHVGAHSAALAALHPLDFDPDEKLDIAAGIGNYNGSNAVAIGAYYRPNESTMISVGGSFGSGKNMVNAGVSVKVGQGNNVSKSRIAMAKEIKDMRTELETLRKAVAGISQGEKVDPVKMKLFPDVAENHWAYEYVKELVKQGVIEGYPDGTFKGDRMMTRYEFAAMLYKVMQKGINVNKKILDEFEVELERFRIDVIAKDKDGNPTIERIRAN